MSFGPASSETLTQRLHKSNKTLRTAAGNANENSVLCGECCVIQAVWMKLYSGGNQLTLYSRRWNTWPVGCSRQFWRSHISPNLGTKCKQWYLHSDTWIFINWVFGIAKFGEPEVEIPPFWRRNLEIKKTVRKPLSLKQKPPSFSYAARHFMPKIVVYQTAPVWFVKNECFMAKIDVYCSLLASDRVIGWDIKMTSHPNSNASFMNIWDRLIWRRSPNLTRSSKLAAAPNCWLPQLTPRQLAFSIVLI